MTKAILIATDGTTTEVEVDGLDDYQEAVGGSIEGVGLVRDGAKFRAAAYINDEGKIEGLELNKVATILYLAQIRAGAFESEIPWLGTFPIADYIAGPMLVIGGVDAAGEDEDVTDETRKLVEVAKSLV